MAPYSTSGARLSGDVRRRDGANGEGAGGDRHRRDPCGGVERESPRGGGGNTAATGSSKCPAAVPLVYELYGVCNHMGGLEGGHYTAHCRGRMGSCGMGEWYTFDDTRVSRVSASRVGGASAYVLFYRLVQPGGG